MTGRRLALLAVGAVTVALLALLARPLLPHHTTSVSSVRRTVRPPSGVALVALRAAREDLRCTSGPRPATGRGCGHFDVTRHETTCVTPARCEVELLGALHTGRLSVPAALSVTLTRPGSAWRVVEVSS
ncbi:MAG TPA: hypothetical protein VG899_13805 [Mycobacteriales bacterium]|nr:hypothetical protein [Mycobacteriales bacterium]